MTACTSCLWHDQENHLESMTDVDTDISVSAVILPTLIIVEEEVCSVCPPALPAPFLEMKRPSPS